MLLFTFMCCEVQSETHAAIKTKRSQRSLGYATKKIFPSLLGKLSRYSDRGNYPSIIQPPDLSSIQTHSGTSP
jgi:hypothetical protein